MPVVEYPHDDDHDHPGDGAEEASAPADHEPGDNAIVNGMIFGMLAGFVLFLLTDEVLYLAMGMMVGLVAGTIFGGSSGERDT